MNISLILINYVLINHFYGDELKCNEFSIFLYKMNNYYLQLNNL